jgi:RNA-directed DNA polymerase
VGKDGSVFGEENTAMSEGTSVNAGVSWPDPHTADLLVRRMQVKLHHWAGADSSRRFHDLFNLVHDPAFLVAAWQRVSTNAGAKTPGVDRMTVSLIANRVGVQVFLDHIRNELKSGTFRPVPARQVMIPKASGKLRKLGIPTVTDRVVQAALKLVLEPIFEADFLPCSYGFRPMRRAQDAVAEIQHMTTRGYEWVLEADIQACFDTIDHVVLTDRIRARIKDKKVLALVKAFLKAGVMTAAGDREDTWTGTPQGGILSPLLANIALSALDEHFGQQWNTEMATKYQRIQRRKQELGNWKLVRYADDFVLVVNGNQHHAQTLHDTVAQVIARSGVAWRQTRPGWCTSTKGSTSSAGTSVGWPSQGPRAPTSTRFRRGRRNRPSGTGSCGAPADQPCTSTSMSSSWASTGHCRDGRTTSATAFPAASSPKSTITPGSG